MGKNNAKTDTPLNFSSPAEQKWYHETSDLVDSLRKNMSHAGKVPYRFEKKSVEIV